MREQIFFKSEEIKGEAKAFPFVRTNKDQETWGLVTSVADQWNFGTDPDPDPRIHTSD